MTPRSFFPSALAVVLVWAFALPGSAQVPDAPVRPAAPLSPTATAPAAGSAQGNQPGLLGNLVPHFDPGSEVLTWDGKMWNVNNERLFEARFEKYLNAPEETRDDDRVYQGIITEILNRLAPGFASTQNIDYAFRLLPRGSNFDADARLCDSLADAVYTVWSAQRQQQRLASANHAMQYEIMSLEAANRHQATVTQNIQQSRQNTANAKPAGGKTGGQGGAAAGPGLPIPSGNSSAEGVADAKQGAVEANNWQTRRWTELVALQQGNEAKRELSEIQAKVEFQALIVQFFLQRRFQHVLMATRFYRGLFSDGDSKLNVGKDTKDLFTRSAGMPPTVSTLDSMANEAIRDVREGVKAFDFLLEKDEMESATKRLAEAFTVGEYLPEIRTLSREKKRKALEFAQKSNQLVSAIEVKDYTLAEKLVKEIAVIAKDFDSSKPLAAVETARAAARLKLQAARNAALSGDRATLESTLKEATEIWPRNPELAEISNMIFDQGDVQQRALIDFDQLLSQKNYRQIYENSARFIAASALYPDRKKQLEEVMEKMKTIEAAILRAQEMSRQSNYPGAWESVEKVAAELPDDSKLNQARADLTTRAADFVRTIRSAEELEKKDQIGSSLAWYLKALKLYPASDFAQDGVERLKKRILPQD